MFFTGKKLHEIFLDLLEKMSFLTGRFIQNTYIWLKIQTKGIILNFPDTIFIFNQPFSFDCGLI